MLKRQVTTDKATQFFSKHKQGLNYKPVVAPGAPVR